MNVIRIKWTVDMTDTHHAEAGGCKLDIIRLSTGKWKAIVTPHVPKGASMQMVGDFIKLPKAKKAAVDFALRLIAENR
jgi:hypothetical protein